MTIAPDEQVSDDEYLGDDNAESIEAAWSQEIERRVAQIANGEVETRSHAEVMADAKARLAAYRAGRPD